MRNNFIISAFCETALIIALFLPCASIAQESPAELDIKKAGYLLSVSASRLNVIGTDLLEIRKNDIILNGSDNPKIFSVTLLIENILLVETICKYEGLLLNTLVNLEPRLKLEQYDFHYFRLKESTLNRLYLSNRNIQTNINSIDNKEIVILAIAAKEEIREVQKRIEGVIKVLHDQSNSMR